MNRRQPKDPFKGVSVRFSGVLGTSVLDRIYSRVGAKLTLSAFYRGVHTIILFFMVIGLGGVALAQGPKILRAALQDEPPNLDISKAADAISFSLIGHVMEGLTRYDEEGNLVPAIAERWETKKNGMVFYLRKGALWSDGKPVRAQDFVFAWRRTIDPHTTSEYAFIMYPIKNGEAINQGKLPPEQLGVRAIDDSTLEVTFEHGCGYFLSLTAFSSYLPQREDFYKKVGDRYAAEADTMLSNGPFKLTEWVHGARLKLEKNPFYWDRKTIKLDVIEFPYITPDATSRFNLYKTKKIDFIETLSKENLTNAQREGFRIKKFLEGTLFYIQFNTRAGQLTANKNLRKAISLVIDRGQFVSRVIGVPGTGLGRGLVPAWMTGTKDKFRKEYPREVIRPQIEKAKEHLAIAMKELGLTKPPTLTWLTTESETAVREAEYMQSLLRARLGITIKIDRQIFKQRLAKMKSGDFEVVSAAWGPDYPDPLTMVDILASWNGNNAAGWKNDRFDYLVKRAMSSSDQKLRMDSLAEAESIALEEVVLIPTYERIVLYTHPMRVKGIVRRPMGGDPDYSRADFND